MTTTELLETLKARGVTLHVEGDLIRYRPRQRAADLLPEMKARKAELLRLLTRPPGASPWPESLDGLGRRHPIAIDRCARCGASTFIAYGGWRSCLGCAQWLEAPAAHYVAVLRRLCALTVSADLDAVHDALREQGRLAEALGDALASRIGAATDAAWYAETGRCPACGESGVFHRAGDAEDHR